MRRMYREYSGAAKAVVSLVFFVAVLVLLWDATPEEQTLARWQVFAGVTAIVAVSRLHDWLESFDGRKWDEEYVLQRAYDALTGSEDTVCYEAPPALVATCRRMVRRGLLYQHDLRAPLFELTDEGGTAAYRARTRK